MNRTLRISALLLTLLFSAAIAKAQVTASPMSTDDAEASTSSIRIESTGIDTAFINALWERIQHPGSLRSMLLQDWADQRAEALSDALDSGKDSVIFEFSTKGISRHHRQHLFLITELEDPRQYEYREPFSMIDFNRVDGFFLGLGSSSMVDFGKHDEIGINGGGGYGFGNKRWQYFGGAEYRLSLNQDHYSNPDTLFEHVFVAPPTLAFGVEFHNQTATDDDWRTQRMENSAYAFFAREDFREYYKLAGYSAYITLRPMRQSEFRVEWRGDDYENRDQTVYYGRWGGNKALPPNYPITEGKFNSLVLTYQVETAREHVTRGVNLLGDSVNFEQMRGKSIIAQYELGHMPGNVAGFNRLLIDERMFRPIGQCFGFDSRIRYEITTGDQVLQKMEYLGGPGSLPGLLNRSLAGDGMLLLNTELRFNMIELSRIFGSDLQLNFLNDFGYVGNAALHGLRFGTVIYNVGGSIGYPSGIQLGVSWRTDIKATARAIVRLQRSF